MFHSHRDDRRRRRSLAEDWSAEPAGPGTAATAPLKAAATPERYPAAARREHHLRISDLIPLRGFTLSLLSLAAIVLTVGLLYGIHTVGQRTDSSDQSIVAGLFETAHGGSLVGWFSSLLYLLAAIGCLQIFSIRRHRLDDYRGSYRLWLWAAAAWTLMSVDATANLHRPFASAMAAATGWSLAGDASIWWLGGWSLCMALLAVRLILETRTCRVAMIGMVLAFVAWIAATVMFRFGDATSLTAMLLAEGLRFAGQLSLLLATAVYARHVLLDANGLLPVVERKPKPPRAKKSPRAIDEGDQEIELSEGAKRTKVEPSHRTADKRTDLQPHTATTAGRSPLGTKVATAIAAKKSDFTASRAQDDDASSANSGSTGVYEDEVERSGDEGDRKLSRAERKRLKKLKRQQPHDD